VNGGRWRDIEFTVPETATVWNETFRARWPLSHRLLSRLVIAIDEIELAVNRDLGGEEPVGDDGQFDRECVSLLRRAMEEAR
jgi:hypothetical protein